MFCYVYVIINSFIYFFFKGKNGSFRLYLEEDGGSFTVLPARGMNELNFAILVNDPSLLDYETSDTKYIEFRVCLLLIHQKLLF